MKLNEGYSIEEAFKALSKLGDKKKVTETVDEKEVCPKCGKEVCECDKAPVEECNKNVVTESAEEDEYLANAKEFAAKVADKMDAATAHDYFYNQYEFDKRGPEDEAEQIVYDALKAKMDVNEELAEDADAEVVADEEAPAEDVDGDEEAPAEEIVDAEVEELPAEEPACFDADFVKDTLNQVAGAIKEALELDEDGVAKVDTIVIAKLEELFPVGDEEVEETAVEVDEVPEEEATEDIPAEE